MRFSPSAILLPLLLGLTVAACSGGGGSTSSPTATEAAPTTPAASATARATSDPSTGSAVTGQVNANTASVDELQAAFAAAGISNADRWAREVAEYRPYPSDPSWAQLRQELSKYNIAPDVLEKIITVLTV
jgi:competence protein ComEA